MPLGIDATIRYGLDIPPTQAILQSQLDRDNPYNTRKLRRACRRRRSRIPGLASIQAAAHPAKVDYLYFVRKPDCKQPLLHGEPRGVRRLQPRGGLQC